jgi:hypothetical protein
MATAAAIKVTADIAPKRTHIIASFIHIFALEQHNCNNVVTNLQTKFFPI